MATQAELEKIAQAAATNWGVPVPILMRLLGWESGGWNPDVISGAKRGGDGEIGIAQFMPSTATQLGQQWGKSFDPSNPVEAIAAAARHLSELAGHYDGDYEKAVAAYNAGQDAVDKAVHDARGGTRENNILTNAVGLSKGTDWKNYIPSSTKDKYLPNVFAEGKDTTSQDDFVRKASATIKGASTPSVPLVGGNGQLSPPNIADFQQDDGNGGKVTDTAGYYKAWSEYQAIQESKQKLASGPLAQYVDDTIKDIQQQIESGKLDLNKANDLLSTKVNTFKNANDVYSSDVFRYGAAPGATSVPGAHPGQTIPFSGGVQLNPLQQALDINNQASSLIGNIQTPQVPSLASIMGGYGGQYGGTTPSMPGASSSPLAAALPSAQQNGAAPTGPISYTGFNGQPSQPPPAPPPPEGASSSVANSSDVAALARILAQQAEGLGAPS